MISRSKAKREWSDFRCVRLCYIRHLHKRKTANGLKDHGNQLSDRRWRLWNNLNEHVYHLLKPIMLNKPKTHVVM